MTVPVPTSTELLVNVLLGIEPSAPPLPDATDADVVGALERAMLPALRRPPCVVSFSGGRDSSAVLAVATQAARRHGLDEPIAATMRFADDPASDERTWQELVLGHLGVREHVVLELTDELDALGPMATSILRERGIGWPGNAYMHAPVLEVARGGSVLTGVGGDELLGTRASRHVLIARRVERPRPLDVAAAALALAPRPVRAAVRRRRHRAMSLWLTDAGRARAERALAADDVAYPHRWDRTVRHWFGTRAYAGLRSTLPTFANRYDVELTSPFLDANVMTRLARTGGATGFASRDVAMQTLFGELLPPAVLTRVTKAGFATPVWGDATRAFAREWSGGGVDATAVDIDALRAEWLSPAPNFATVLLLHTAWLHENGQTKASTS